MSDSRDRVDLSSPSHKANPHELYARLRRDQPVVRARGMGGRECWLVTGHADAVQVLRDPRLAKDATRAGHRAIPTWLPLPRSLRALSRNMLDLDGSDHARLRRLAVGEFTESRVDALRHAIAGLCEERARVLCAGGSGDLVRDFAEWIPPLVIVRLLGLPAGIEAQLVRWSRSIVAADTAFGKARALPALFSLTRMLRRAVRDQRMQGRNGLLGLLVEARDDEDRLSEDELVAMLFLLTIAGFETTVHLIGNGWLALLQHPDQLEAWRADPGLGPSAIEELLRFATPLETTTERYAIEDVELGEVSVRRGEMVLVAIASVNRDESVFDSPDTLDLRRADNPHLSFGLGNHYCLGARLARLEARLAFEALFAHAPGLRLAVEARSLVWKRGAVTRGLRALPVSLATTGGR